MFYSNPNPDPSPAASGYICRSSAAGEGEQEGKGCYSAIHHDFIVIFEKFGVIEQRFHSS